MDVTVRFAPLTEMLAIPLPELLDARALAMLSDVDSDP
jgi:hypothetical protein